MNRMSPPLFIRLTLLFISLATVFFSACDRSAVPSADEKRTEWPKVDKSTPDNALRTYWATRDELRRYIEATDATERAQVRQTLETIMTNPIARGYISEESGQNVEAFSRDILEVKIESDSRAMAIALIKNITPIPPGAEMTDYEEQLRRDGERYKYILQKDSSGWRVAEIWQWATYPAPDWRKFLPGDGKPRVAYLTYGGM